MGKERKMEGKFRSRSFESKVIGTVRISIIFALDMGRLRAHLDLHPWMGPDLT